MSKDEGKSSDNSNSGAVQGHQIIVVTPEQLAKLPNNQPIYILSSSKDPVQEAISSNNVQNNSSQFGKIENPTINNAYSFAQSIAHSPPYSNQPLQPQYSHTSQSVCGNSSSHTFAQSNLSSNYPPGHYANNLPNSQQFQCLSYPQSSVHNSHPQHFPSGHMPPFRTNEMASQLSIPPQELFKNHFSQPPPPPCIPHPSNTVFKKNQPETSPLEKSIQNHPVSMQLSLPNCYPIPNTNVPPPVSNIRPIAGQPPLPPNTSIPPPSPHIQSELVDQISSISTSTIQPPLPTISPVPPPSCPPVQAIVLPKQLLPSNSLSSNSTPISTAPTFTESRPSLSQEHPITCNIPPPSMTLALPPSPFSFNQIPRFTSPGMPNSAFTTNTKAPSFPPYQQRFVNNVSAQSETSAMRTGTPFLQPPSYSHLDMSVPPPPFPLNSLQQDQFGGPVPPSPTDRQHLSNTNSTPAQNYIQQSQNAPKLTTPASVCPNQAKLKRRVSRWDTPVNNTPPISSPLPLSPPKPRELPKPRDTTRKLSPPRRRSRSPRSRNSSFNYSSNFKQDRGSSQSSRRNSNQSRFSSQPTRRPNFCKPSTSDKSNSKESNPLPEDVLFTSMTCSSAPDYFQMDEKTGNVKATGLMIKLEERFDTNILNRRSHEVAGIPPWTPLDRTNIEDLDSGLAQASTASGGEQDSDFSSDMSISSSSSECESSLPNKRRRRKKNKKGKPGNQKKPKTISLNELINEDDSAPALMTIRNNTIRTARQRREIEYKMAHPLKLHPDLWFNERGEYNDGPACSCMPKYRIGPLHNVFEGETYIPPCDPESNNKHRLYHYRIHIDPARNFKLKAPTTIHHLNKDFVFDGFSMFTHYRLEMCPPCEILRFNHFYKMTYTKEEFPENFTVRSADQLTDLIYKELLELVDIQWFADSANGAGCRIFHLLPRFVHTEGSAGEMLSTSALLTYLLASSQPVIDAIDLAHINRMERSEWSEYIQDVRGTIVTMPGKKPAAIRVDQLDRKSADQETCESVLIYPYIVHITYTPIKLSLSRDPKYKKVWKNFMRLQYLMMNKSRITEKDRTCLNRLAEKLETMETNNKRRREITIEISSEGFYRTGLKTDVTQMALVLPSFLVHIRFHKSLESLEERLEHKFQNKALLHQALTHPSFQRTNFGSNQDHVMNSTMNCGFRYIDYGDRLQLYKGWRRKGLTPMIQIMSHMPNYEEKQSPIYGNERLEFLGDAVIEIISSVHLFFLFPNMSEGHLDAYRQALVQNHHLSQLAIRLGIHRFILYTHSTDFCLDTTFMHARSDAFEALMAAVALDGGLNIADRIFGSVLFGDDETVLKVWFSLPPHPLQQQELGGDRDWIEKTPLLKNLTQLEDNLGFQFKHIRLLARSLTVRKTGFNLYTLGDNQRLEFLGDSLLKYVSTDYLFKHFPQHHEGHLSLLKNSLVNKYTQSDICNELGLENFVIQRSEGNHPTATKERTLDQKIKYKADILEAFLGAMFVDKDLVWVERFCQVCFWPRLIEFILKQEWNDSKSKLQQCCLTLRGLDEEEPEIAQYKVLDYRGPSNRRVYNIGVYFRGERLATGTARTVKMAEMDAAENALKIHYDAFPQLRYQQSVIKHRYNDKFINTMLNQVSSSDQLLVDKFVNNVESQEDLLAQASYSAPSTSMKGTLADILGPRPVKPNTDSVQSSNADRSQKPNDRSSYSQRGSRPSRGRSASPSPKKTDRCPVVDSERDHDRRQRSPTIDRFQPTDPRKRPSSPSNHVASVPAKLSLSNDSNGRTAKRLSHSMSEGNLTTLKVTPAHVAKSYLPQTSLDSSLERPTDPRLKKFPSKGIAESQKAKSGESGVPQSSNSESGGHRTVILDKIVNYIKSTSENYGQK